ncbi:hypothetical protein ACWIB8_01910 [Corynebacterium flavescens]
MGIDAVLLRRILRALVQVLVLGIGWWARKHPNTVKTRPNRQRMPKFIAIFGWVLLVVGAVQAAIGLSTDPARANNLKGMLVASALMILAGLVFVVIQHNWFVEPGADRVDFRTVFGREKNIEYQDIVRVREYSAQGQPFIQVRDSHGTKLGLSLQLYDMSPLLDYLDAHPSQFTRN